MNLKFVNGLIKIVWGRSRQVGEIAGQSEPNFVQENFIGIKRFCLKQSCTLLDKK